MTEISHNLYRGPQVPPQALVGRIAFTLDLESGKQVFGDDLPLVEQRVGDWCGIRVYAHPLGAIFPPSRDEVEEAIEFIRDKQESGAIYIHCKHGADRTGYIVAAYRMVIHGWSFRDAVKEMFEHGFHKIPYLLWIPALWWYARRSK